MWPTKLSRCGIITDNTLCPASGPKLQSYISADEIAFAHPQAHVGILIKAIKIGSVFHENLEHTAYRRGRGYVILRVYLHPHAPVPKPSNDDIEIAPAFLERHPGRSAIAACNSSTAGSSTVGTGGVAGGKEGLGGLKISPNRRVFRVKN